MNHMLPPTSVETETNVQQKVLVVRLSAMGDIIHTLPAVAALRKCFPNAMLGWAVEERWAELVKGCRQASPSGKPLADKVHTVNMKGWRQALLSDRTWREIAAAVKELRCVEYDIAIDFQGSARSALLARLSRADSIYGFAEPRENVASMFYTKKILAAGRHVIEQNLSLVSAIAGGPVELADVEFSCDLTGEVAAKLAGEYAVINPGTGWGAKQWPAERYGEVAKRVADATGLKFLINAGPGEESLANAARQASGGAAQPLTCSPSELVSVLKRARLFVGGDTGPMHLAAALRVPVVAIFGPTDPARNGPYGTRSIVLRNSASVTSLSHRNSPDEPMLEITADEVTQAALQLLRGRGE